jgi:hypothetical protein
MLSKALKAAEGIPPLPQEEEELESWLDWGLDLLREVGPVALEMAPALLALL